MREVISLLGMIDISKLAVLNLLSEAGAFIVVQSDNTAERDKTKSNLDFLSQLKEDEQLLLATAQALPRQGREYPIGRTRKQNWPIKPAFVPTDRLHRRGIRHG